MCGIFSYFGPRQNVEELVIKGLKNLEYRVYDSWGIAYRSANGIHVEKKVGKIGERELPKHPVMTGLPLNIALGHSRWATHGGVTEINAHPHMTEDKEVVLVHNGIVENFFELKEELMKNGVKFRSETDTEVIVHLIKLYLHEGFEEAVKKALKRIKGRFAIVVLTKSENKLIAARLG